MVKELVIYPDERIKITSADVRVFDEKLCELIENMKDTLNANALNALSAIQIAVPATVIVIKKENGEFIELVNPRIINVEGSVTSTETTAYLPNLDGTLKRHEKISIVYQDRDGIQKSLKADGDLAITIQRKIDYTFGGTYIDKLDKKSQKEIEKKLEYGFVQGAGGTCPTTYKRDYFVKAIKYLFYLGFAMLFAKLVVDKEALTLLYAIENYISLTILLLIFGYFIYSQYEIRVYKSCTSCQTGNIVGTVVISSVKLLALFLLNYFLIKP